jgi:hypothetical protein
LQLVTADTRDAIEELQQICLDNAAVRRDQELFREYSPHVVSLALNPQQQSPDFSSFSDDGHNIAAVAKSIGMRDSASMRRMISGLIREPAAAAAVKRNSQMRRVPGVFITQNDSKVPRLSTASSPLLESSESACARLKSKVIASVLSFCASIAHDPTPTPCPLLIAAIARLQLVRSLPILPCTSRSLLREVLTLAVEKCGCRVTEKCGFGPESFELEPDSEIVEERKGEGFPIKLMLCCKNEEFKGSMTGIIGCFFEDWLESALHGNRRFVVVYVDVALMGSDVDCTAVLECIVLQVRVFAAFLGGFTLSLHLDQSAASCGYPPTMVGPARKCYRLEKCHSS